MTRLAEFKVSEQHSTGPATPSPRAVSNSLHRHVEPTTEVEKADQAAVVVPAEAFLRVSWRTCLSQVGPFNHSQVELWMKCCPSVHAEISAAQ